jgi:lipooligosaccharide transport system ATP-binding protein
MHPIEVRGVVKRYGPIRAVDGLDITVPEGTCVGLLGPNGAGKSTTMRMLTGQTVADEGTVHVLGHELPADSKAARQKMGVVPQLDNLDVDLTVAQTFSVFGRLYGVRDRKAATQRALEICTLTDRHDTKVDKLSGGMRRRLLIARALLHQPQLILMDEPTVGLDPQVRQELWGLIDRLRGEGVSILMSTHYIEEAERLADTVIIVSQGKAVAGGRPSELVRELVGTQVTEVYGPPDHLARVEEHVRGEGFKTRRTGTAIAILGSETANGSLPDGHVRAANLEDVFVLLTGEVVE